MNVIGHFRKNPHFQNEARCTTFLLKMSIIWMRMKNDFHIKGWRLTFPRKKLEFKSSEMTKNVSIIHKVERSFIYFLHYSLWKSYMQLLTLLVLKIWLSFCYFGKFKLFGWKKFIYGYRCSWLRSLHDIFINGEGFFAKFCFLVCFLFPCLYWHVFFQIRTCVRA